MGSYLALVVCVVVLALTVASGASAATYTYPCAGTIQPELCERLEASVEESEKIRELNYQLAVASWFLYGGVLMLIAAPMMSAAFRWWRA